jgi:hypothetical protein
MPWHAAMRRRTLSGQKTGTKTERENREKSFDFYFFRQIFTLAKTET